MSSLNDIHNYVEQQRERLEAVVHKLTTEYHKDGSCPQPPHVCAATDFEHALKAIDAETVRRGVPWHVGVKHLADAYEHALQRMREEQT